MHIVHRHAGEVAGSILVDQELDPDGLAYPRAKVYLLINPTFAVGTLMIDGLEYVAAGIGDVSILPVEGNAVDGAIPVPEA